MGDDAIAALAVRLANTGERLDTGPFDTADVASTGGPGSLSTLLCPLFLVANGLVVPKLGVPGRPAGGIDALALIPGYRTVLSTDEIVALLETCGYAHVQAGGRFAPADAALFSYRQRHGAQAVSALAIASLLSKKVAMGVRSVGLEVRVGAHGNFGDTEAARGNAARFCAVARLLGIDATCILTPGGVPQQPWIGRGEALAGLASVLSGATDAWLGRHLLDCGLWAEKVARGVARGGGSDLAGAFRANVLLQGGTLEGFDEVVADTLAGHVRSVAARHHGIVHYDLGRLRSAVLAARAEESAIAFPDDAGVRLLVEPGRWVRSGDPLISARCRDDAWPQFQRGLIESVSLLDGPQADEATTAAAAEFVRV